jgi:phage-related tail fiber protein
MYQTILTNYGLARVTAAIASGTPINLTQMAVGDGGGPAVTPSVSMTALVNERFRATLNRVQQDPANPTKYYVELLIPATTGGWWIREYGIFDSTGALFAVGNFPDSYKTVPSDGASSDLAIRAEVIVSNAGVINIMVDPSLAVATQSWVTTNINSAALIPGGTTNQVLRKHSNANGDVEWADPASATILVNTIEEQQFVTANPQLTFNLTTVTTTGLSVLVEGVRLPRRTGAGGWQQGASSTQVVLGTQYPIGSEITFLQNEPASNIPDPLTASLNLSDVQNVATARANLSVYSKSESDQLQPAGNVAFSARSTPPTGWLAANGAAVSRTVYASLFAAIGTTYGVGDGSATFNLPDLRGEFIRGLDSGRGVDVGRLLGSAQADSLKSHTHAIGAGPYTTHGFIAGGGDGFSTSFTSTTGATGGSETRPRNVALLAIIKY